MSAASMISLASRAAIISMRRSMPARSVLTVFRLLPSQPPRRSQEDRMDRVNLDFEFKFASGAADGTFSGYGAVTGNVDAYGDRIDRGAFKETLREWEG